MARLGTQSWIAGGALVAAFSLISCGGDGAEPSTCDIGTVEACACDRGGAGTRVCLGDAFSPCSCSGPDAPGADPRDVSAASRDVPATTAGGDGAGTDAPTNPDAPTDAADAATHDSATQDDATRDGATPDATAHGGPTWIAYLADGGSFDHVWLGATDQSVAPLALELDAMSLQRSPTFSDDGTRLAYVHASPTETGVRVVDLASGERTLLTVPGLASYGHPNFSPDGRSLAVVAGASAGTGQVRVFDLETGSAGPELTSVAAPEFVSSPVFDAEGTGLYFVTGVGGSGSGEADLWHMDLDGTNAAQITDGLVVVGRVVPDPARSRVVTSLLGGGLFLVDLATGDSFGLGGAGDATSAAWLDAETLVIAGGTATAGDVMRFELARGVPSGQLTATPDVTEVAPAVSSAGLTPLATTLSR